MFKEIITKDEIKFNKLEKKIFKFVCFLGCMLIKYFLEKYDQKLAKTRDRARYRHKGYRENTVKTVMGEVTYKRAMYLETERGKTRYMFLLDETLNICVEGNISKNLAETAIEVVVNSTSYRKAAENLNKATNQTISHETLRNLTVNVGTKIEQKEKEEIYGEIEKEIPIDNSVEEWMEEIESNITKGYRNLGIGSNYENISNCETSKLSNAPRYIKEIVKEIGFLDMRCSF